MNKLTMAAQFGFWASLGLVAYAYCGFPWLVRFLARWCPEPGLAGRPPLPSFAVIVTGCNEEAAIAARIENLLALDYPRELVEIAIACDGCTDATAEIAAGFSAHGVRVFDFPQNRGKAAVHNDVVPRLGAAILLFTDAETAFAPDFLSVLARYFANPRNGCGSGDLTLRPQGEIGQAECSYWNYEKRIRYCEYRLGLLPFASGACLAIRRELFHPIPLYSAEDNFLCYTAPADGYRVFYAREARCWDWSVPDHARHYRKRYRTALKSFQGAMGCVPLLARGRCWGPLWALISHRLLRWQSGFFLALALLCNFLLLDRGWLYRFCLALQACLYASAGVGWWLQRRQADHPRWRFFALAHGFVSANLAFCHAMLHTAAGRRLHQYQPARQQTPSAPAPR